MIPTSDTYQKVAAKTPLWHGKATVILENGVVLHLTNSNLLDGGIDIEDSASNQGEFNVGSANAGQLVLIIDNRDGDFTNYDFTGATIIPYVGLQLPEPDELNGGDFADYLSGDTADGGLFSDYAAGYVADGGIFLGTIEWIQKGIYTVDKSTTSGNRISLSALDNMAKFDRPYSESALVYPATLGQILGDACAHCGVGLSTASFLNSNYMVEKRPDDSAITFRDIVSFVAQLAGCYAHINRFGSLELKWYEIDLAVKGAEVDLNGGTFSDYEVADEADGGDFMYYKRLIVLEGGLFKYPEGKAAQIQSLSACSLQTDTVKITGIQIVPTDTEQTTYYAGRDGYMLSIENNPLAQNNIDQLVSNIGSKLIGFEFLPLSVSCLGRPEWEAGDVAVVTYKGYKHTAIISNLRYVIRDYETITADAESESERNSKRYSAAAKAEASSKQATEQEFIAYDVAVRNLSALMANALGFYMISEKQEDGSFIEYMCDKPTLAQSTVIWKRTIQGFAISTDGGQTWGAGFTADGNAVVKVLTALGINADWINAGHVSADRISGGTIDASNVNVTNLNASNITTGNFNANLITTGKIQSHDGAAYFDLDNNEIAATKIVDYSGNDMVKIRTDDNGNPIVSIPGTLNVGNVSANSLTVMGRIWALSSGSSMQVVTDIQENFDGSLRWTYGTIHYIPPS
jgi:hypothetical protein